MKHYTLDEANAALPELRRLIASMQIQGQQVSAMRERVTDIEKKVHSNGDHNPSEDVLLTQSRRQAEHSLQEAIDRISAMDIQLKDLQQGLVDFPALLEGRTVYLCWRLGESSVEYWHEVDAGFSGRRPIGNAFD